MKHDDAASAERERRLTIISPVLAIPPGTPERARAVQEIAARPHPGPDGRPVEVTGRTIYRWLDAYQKQGAAGLQRFQRRDARKAKVLISRAWDRAVPFDDATRQAIAGKLRPYINGLRAAGESPGAIAMLARFRLAQATRAAGFDPGPEHMEAICSIPDRLIKGARHYAAVNRFRTDRKAHEDERLRHKRTRSFLPMQCVVGDVHPIDILCRRADGTEATARLIAWQDLATNRIWGDAILLDQRRGVTNVHVIRSFMAMVAGWGMPGQLYVDNGQEYICADFIGDALKLAGRDGRRMHIEHDGNERGVRRARPYNAQSKPIEGLFAILERNHLPNIPGHIGGDRMRKKSANVGRPPVPFPGTFDQLRALIADALAFYHLQRQGRASALKGRSPYEAFREAVAAGWTPTAIDPDALRLAFSTRKVVANRGGGVQVDGRTWTCPELREHHEARVVALVPKYEEWACLPLFDLDDRPLGLAEPQATTDFFDPAGARLSEQYAQDRRRGVRKLERSVPRIKPLEERRAFLEAQPPEPAPAAGALIGASTQAGRFLAEMKETPAERALRRAIEEEERMEQRRLRIARASGNGGR